MNENMKNRGRSVVWWNVFFGLWLAISPFVLGFTNPALRWSNVAVGGAVILLAFFHPGAVRAFPVLLGAWIFASTFLLGFYQISVFWNNIILALAIVCGAIASEGILPADTSRSA